MTVTRQIRDVVFNYVNHGDLDAFVVEFAKLSHNIHHDGDAAAVELSHKVESLFAISRTHGWQECKLRDALRNAVEFQIATNLVNTAQFSDPVNQLVVVEKAFQASFELSGTSPAVGFGLIQNFQR